MRQGVLPARHRPSSAGSAPPVAVFLAAVPRSRAAKGGGASRLRQGIAPVLQPNPEDQTQDHSGKKAEGEYQPDHDDDNFDCPPLAHHAAANGFSRALHLLPGVTWTFFV